MTDTTTILASRIRGSSRGNGTRCTTCSPENFTVPTVTTAMAGETLCWATLGTSAARRRGTSVLIALYAARRHPTFINISGVYIPRNPSPSLSSIEVSLSLRLSFLRFFRQRTSPIDQTIQPVLAFLHAATRAPPLLPLSLFP